MKLLKRFFLAVLLLVVLGVAALFIFVNPLAKSAVEKGSTYALGVDTTLDSADVGLTSGDVKLAGLNVSNPKGFTAPRLMNMKKFEMSSNVGSFMGETIELRKFELDGLEVNIEQTLKGSNVQAILENLKKLGGGDSKKEQSPGKRFRVDSVVIKDVVANFHVLADVHKGGAITIRVPEIRLNNVTKDNAKGLAIDELFQRILPAILASIMEKGKGVVPGDLLAAINGDISGLSKQIGGEAEKMISQARGDVEKMVGKEAGKIVGNLTNVLGDANKPVLPIKGLEKALDANKAGKSVGKALDGLLGGKKK